MWLIRMFIAYTSFSVGSFSVVVVVVFISAAFKYELSMCHSIGSYYNYVLCFSERFDHFQRNYCWRNANGMIFQNFYYLTLIDDFMLMAFI